MSRETSVMPLWTIKEKSSAWLERIKERNEEGAASRKKKNVIVITRNIKLDTARTQGRIFYTIGRQTHQDPPDPQHPAWELIQGLPDPNPSDLDGQDACRLAWTMDLIFKRIYIGKTPKTIYISPTAEKSRDLLKLFSKKKQTNLFSS